MKQEFQIAGMSCGHCVKAVRAALEQVNDVSVLEVSIGGATIELSHSVGTEAAAGPIVRAAKDAIEDEGYAVVSSRMVSVVDES